jgi:hypothetical protein
MTAIKARYRLPKKAIKGNCPQCSPRHRKTLSRFVDTETGDILPEPFGRCDRESNCGYILSPYDKGASGMSYADEQKAPPLPKEWFQLAGKLESKGEARQTIHRAMIEQGANSEQAERVTAYVCDRAVRSQPLEPAPIYFLPDEVLQKTLGNYDRNEFACYLTSCFGSDEAHRLLKRFQIGTSNRWPGACVFWIVDEQKRVRGGQICLYDQTGHKVKYTVTDKEGKEKKNVCITSVKAALRWKYRDVTPPKWLANLPDDAETWPVAFGMPQLQTAPVDMPVALVEGPKSAVICTYFMPDILWLAVGGKSYLKPERLAGLKGRRLILYPDLGAYDDWKKRAEILVADGFDIDVSDVLEIEATDKDRENGLDLADYLLREPKTVTPKPQPAPTPVVVEPVPTTTPLIRPLTEVFAEGVGRPVEENSTPHLIINEFGYPAFWDDVAVSSAEEPEQEQTPLERMAHKNPALSELISVLDLVLVDAPTTEVIDETDEESEGEVQPFDAWNMAELEAFFATASLPANIPPKFVTAHLNYCQHNNGSRTYKVYYDRLVSLKTALNQTTTA